MKIFLRLIGLLLLLIFAAGGFVVWQVHEFLYTPPTNQGSEVLFDVQPGASFRNVAQELESKGLITDARKFTFLAMYKQWDNKLQAGRFALNSAWIPEDILEQLVKGRPVLSRITIREGLTWWETGYLLEKAGFLHFNDFRDVITNADFLRHYGIPFKTAEGFLMPDTYLLEKVDEPNAATARAIAGRLIDTFWQKMKAHWPNGTKPQEEELQRLVILASIVEKETGIPTERARVAGVYSNRLRIKMLLQADPTTIYGLGPAFNGNLRRSHLKDAQNLYNTYQRPGLPPGPICSPGVAAIRAAITPEKHNFLYFVAITDGGEHAFSRTLAEHNRAVRRYLDNRKKK